MKRIGLFLAAILTAFSVWAEEPNPSTFITSWNAFSKQFIDAPEFHLLPIPGSAQFRAVVRQNGREWTVRSASPILTLQRIWRQVKPRKFTVIFRWLDAHGALLKEEAGERVKAPDFMGLREHAVDWSAAADRNIAYLLHESGHNSTAPYREPGIPVWIWAATPHHEASYPCITINNMIWAFLAHVKNDGPQSVEALKLARVGADWALAHRQPNSGALPLFPYSTITKGNYGGSVEGESVNLLRASWLAISFVDLYAATKHEPYLEYARHIADTTIKFQNADGSFPYRVNPKTGAVTEQYNCSVMEFVELTEKLEPFGFDARRAMAAQRALDWALAYVCATSNWKAAYEDVSETRFYSNLSQMPAQPLVRYLCRHKNENPAYLPTAIRLNRWIEDQFVTFGPGNESSPVRVKGPLVFEQFVCWWPMDGHTANWILSLIELHKATHNRDYLDKAKAAANAICAEQYEDGQFSTWGRDYQTGDSPAKLDNWYNAGAFSDWALYALAQYTRGLKE
ncbi:MAG: hypothetical protein HZB26_11210 [Candidatus Hydrogenedentes bacterium]|nr:hypothetical protein [Candidatus Hydrogenedentota bacterium]